jgi:hypothetical protein
MARACDSGGWDFIKVGETYQYKEGGLIADILILEDRSTDEFYVFKVRFVASSYPIEKGNREMEISYSKTFKGYFHGMSQLFSNSPYYFTNRIDDEE